MPKIIKRGRKPEPQEPLRLTCSRCGTIAEYARSEIQRPPVPHGETRAVCPVCDHYVSVGADATCRMA